LEKFIMKMIKRNTNQSIPILWTPLPDCQQELLSGGAPRVSSGGGGGTGGSGGSGSTSGTASTTDTI
jgi:hypothetical protein